MAKNNNKANKKAKATKDQKSNKNDASRLGNKKIALSVWVVAASIPGLVIALLLGLEFPYYHPTAVNQPPASSSSSVAENGEGRKARETTATRTSTSVQKGGPPGSWTHGYYADELDEDVPPASNAWIYPNGGYGIPEYTSFATDADFESLGRVYNNLGQIVPSRHHFANGASLYSGPTKPGQHFQWPSVKVGLRRTVPGLFGGDGKPIEIETLTDPNDDDGFSPRVFYVHNFLSASEAEEFVRFSTSDDNPYKMAPSTAGSHKSWDKEGGRDATSSTRTSMNAFDISSNTQLTVKQRGFRLLRLGQYDESLADGVQILRYELGQAYIAHTDYFPTSTSNDHNWDPEKGGSNRMATIFLYLSDVEYGGQTVFPELKRLTNETSADLVKRLENHDVPTKEGSTLLDDLTSQANIKRDSWEDQLIGKCHSSFAIPPRKGDAILFYSQKPDGRLDPASLHGACPILSGTKWGANVWIWNACRFSTCKVDPLHPAEELPPRLKAPFY